MAAIFDAFRARLGRGIAKVNALPIHETRVPRTGSNLGLTGDFSPSKKLIAFWFRGVTALGGEAPIELRRFNAIREVALADLKRVFSQDLVAVFGDYAFRASGEVSKHVFITELRRFQPRLQVAICEQFYIVPDESAEFMHLLFRELTFSLISGCTVSGEWGSLNSSHYELCLQLKAQHQVHDNSFIQSVELE